MSPDKRRASKLVKLVLGTILCGGAALADDLDGKIVTEIRISGLRHTKDYVVRRELSSRVGERYSAAHVAKDAERLDRLRIFSSIDVRPVATDAGVEIRIAVRETFPYLPTLSLQVTDENGLSAGPGLKSVNFLGKSIELSAAAQFGGATNVDLYVRDPWVFGNHVSYEAQYLRRDRPNELDRFEELANEIDVRFGSFIGERGRIGIQGGFTTIRSDRDGITLSPERRDEMPAVGVYLGYDTRDIWSRPSRGWWNEVGLVKTDVLGTDADFWTTTIDIRRYHTWNDRHTVSATSLTTLQPGTLGVDIPIHADFHLGGTNTIRGWALDSRSGKNQLINTVEYRYLLSEPQSFKVWFFTAYLGLQLAAFADYGHAWSEPGGLALDRFIGGYGVGLRLLMPFVDEMRFDVAWGQPGEGITFHFGLYPKAVMQRVRVR